MGYWTECAVLYQRKRKWRSTKRASENQRGLACRSLGGHTASEDVSKELMEQVILLKPGEMVARGTGGPSGLNSPGRATGSAENMLVLLEFDLTTAKIAKLMMLRLRHAICSK